MKIIISEDHELFRDGLKSLIAKNFQDIEILESESFPQTIALLHTHSDIDLVLFDIYIPGTVGLEGLTQIKEKYPVLPVIVMSSVDNPASIKHMLDIGADGFISKGTNRADLIQAFNDVFMGEKVIVTDKTSEYPAQLARRHQEIIGFLDKGLSNKQIANEVNLSPVTIRDYVSELFGVFGCKNRTELVVKLRKLGHIID